MSFLFPISEAKVQPTAIAVSSKTSSLPDSTKSALKSLPYVLPSLMGGMSSTTKRNKKREKTREYPDGTTWAINTQSFPSIPRRLYDNRVYTTSQEYVTTLTSISNTTPTFGALNFQVSSLPQIADLSNVFDQYKIDLVEVWITPLGQNIGNYQRTASVIDYDDSAVLTTFNAALNYPNCVCTMASNGHYRKFRPHMAVAAFASSAFTSYKNVPSDWIDMVSQNVEHYGLKWAAEAATSNNTVDVLVRLTCSFRKVR